MPKLEPNQAISRDEVLNAGSVQEFLNRKRRQVGVGVKDIGSGYVTGQIIPSDDKIKEIAETLELDEEEKARLVALASQERDERRRKNRFPSPESEPPWLNRLRQEMFSQSGGVTEGLRALGLTSAYLSQLQKHAWPDEDTLRPLGKKFIPEHEQAGWWQEILDYYPLPVFTLHDDEREAITSDQILAAAKDESIPQDRRWIAMLKQKMLQQGKTVHSLGVSSAALGSWLSRKHLLREPTLQTLYDTLGWQDPNNPERQLFETCKPQDRDPGYDYYQLFGDPRRHEALNSSDDSERPRGDAARPTPVVQRSRPSKPLGEGELKKLQKEYNTLIASYCEPRAIWDRETDPPEHNPAFNYGLPRNVEEFLSMKPSRLQEIFDSMDGRVQNVTKSARLRSDLMRFRDNNRERVSAAHVGTVCERQVGHDIPSH